MLYLALGGAALALYLYVTGGKPLFKGRDWRIAGGVAGLAAFTAAAFLGVRGEWAPAVALAVVGLWFASTARKPGAPRAPSSRMSVDEARRILGVGADASREQIQAAYTRLMRLAHPDKGGTAGLAAQLNAARDRLLDR